MPQRRDWMADQLLFTREASGERSSQRVRRSAVRSAVTSRSSIVLIAIAGLVVAALATFQYGIAPKVLIQHYSIESDLGASQSAILSAAGLVGKQYYFKVSTQQIAARLNAWAPVKHATVQKVFPHGLKISLVGRKPVAMAMADVNGHEVPVAFDEDGVVFESGDAIASLDLPVFSGITFRDFTLGVRLPPMLLDFIREVNELKLSSPGLYDLISEYRIIPRNDHEFDVMVYPVHHHVAIEIGPHIDRTLCMYILRVLDVMDHDGSISKVKEIDFRTSDVVYTR